MNKNILNKKAIKTIVTAFFVIGTMAFSSANAGVLGSRVPSEVLVDKTYGNSSDVEIVLNGLFPNGCYQKLETIVETINNEIFIKNRIAYERNGLCTMALRPYTDTIQIHDLEPGKHTIFIKNKSGNYQQVDSFTI